MSINTKNTKSLIVSDNDAIKWENEGKRYCLHIQRDGDSMDPRVDFDNITTMACFHRRYNLGDKLNTNDPQVFWRDLVAKYVSNDEIVKAIKAGEIDEFSIERDEDDPDSYIITNYQILPKVYGKREKHIVTDRAERTEKEIPDYVLYEMGLSIKNCQILLEPYIEWLPLWLYDHSGITMSAGERVYPYNDRWDSSLVGWIVAARDTIMEETTELILDENGEPIREEHKHEGGLVTYGYASRPLTEDTWRKRAVEVMQEEVKMYDQYLTGEVYGFTLYQANSEDEDEAIDESDMEELDSCWGFFGDDIFESGIADEIGYGFKEAIEAGKYEIGKASLHHVSYYTF